MAHQWLRCNLLSSDFPLLSDLFGEPVFIKGLDQPFTSDGPYTQVKGNDAQLFYCENVMPTSAGYQGIGFINRNINNDPPVGAHGLIHDAYNFSALAGTSLVRLYLAASDSDYAGLYVFNALLGNNWSWVVLPGAPALTSPRQISSAIVNNQCYICPDSQGVYHFNAGPSTFTADALIGITATAINGICASNGLLLAWTKPNVVVWSSDQNPLDFTPSLVTGAGGGSINEVKGDITYCAPIAGGFLIYSTQNVVQASFTGNVAFPFKFQEISGSGGTFNNNQIGFHDNSDTQFAWTDKGMQTNKIDTISSIILPKISEFLMAGFYETFDPVTGNFTKVTQNLLYPVKSFRPVINFIASRYLTISYGWSTPSGFIDQYDYCLVFDVETGRFGKIKFTHVDTLDCVVDFQGRINPIARIGFITSTGVVQTIDQTLDSTVNNTGDGLIVIGKFQLQRNKGVFHQRTKAECVYDSVGNPFTISACSTLDGKNFLTPTILSPLYASSGVKVFGGKVYGLNISLLIQGPFNLSSLQADFTLGGSDRSYG